MGPICGDDPMARTHEGEHPRVMATEHESELTKERPVIGRDRSVAGFRASKPAPAIERLLFIADTAVADADDLPPSVRALIDAAAELYVVPPTLPGRLAWLADDVDGFRHVADERLDTVLGHMRSIGASASGAAVRGSLLTVIADAVADFEPDHILIAMRSAEHANWQERKLIAHVEDAPAASAVIPDAARTGTGEDAVVPRPSAPHVPSPKQSTSPALLRAQVWPSPSATAR